MRFDDVPKPEPGPGEVLLRVAGTGACHSDLHVAEMAAHGKLPWPMPFTLGHEIAGTVDALGDGAAGVAIGDTVAVYTAWGCGRCPACLSGSENYCENFALMRGGGLGRDGGMAAYVVVPATRYLVPLGDLDPIQAAPLADAGITAYHAVKRTLPLLAAEGAACVVIGVGGLGHLGIQAARALAPGLRIIAVDVSDDKLALAREVGADVAVLSDDSTIEAVRANNAGRGADVVLDFVGSQATMDLARKAVRANGEIALVGLAGGTLPVRPGSLPYGVRVSMTFYGSIDDLHATIDLARTNKLRAHVTEYPLDRADEAFAALRDGTLAGRAVICPNNG
jgi:propanol-preferring alcohol dehydrogenase